MYFKGGTSLSKAWNLIYRFSEDVDIVLYRNFFEEVLGYKCAECESKTQIRNLREVSRDYITGTLATSLKVKLSKWRIQGVTVEPVTMQLTKEGKSPLDHDKDPTVLLLHYPSIFSSSDTIIDNTIKIEISCLSMDEPFEKRHISSMLSEYSPDKDDEVNTNISTVLPSRTVLEIIMDTDYGKQAVFNVPLYLSIINHRKKYYALNGVDYDNDLPENIRIVPPNFLINSFKSDYEDLKRSYIYGDRLDFDALVTRLETLQKRIRSIKTHLL